MSTTILAFLREARERLGSSSRLNVVLGNESLDLDSAACTIAYAHAQSLLSPSAGFHVPILNVERRDLPLKTEVLHVLESSDIPSTVLICKDEFYFEGRKTEDLGVTLVDHHVLSRELRFLQNQIDTIFDHRPLAAEFPKCKKKFTHSIVGSCASLLVSELLPSGYRDPVGLRLLYDAILTDTMNLKTDVTTPVDVKAVELIEEHLPLLKPEARSIELDAILKAKSSIESLSMEQLLRKDRKVISSSTGEPIRRASLSSLSVSIKALRMARSSNFFDGLKNYLIESSHHQTGEDFGILTGMTYEENVMKRDMILYALDTIALGNLRDYLLGIKVFELEVVEENFSSHVEIPHVLINIGNGSISRKKLLPRVQEYLNK